MSFDISVFRSNVNNQNMFTRENAFEIAITLPSGLSKYDSQLITLNCQASKLPGASLQTIGVARGTNSLEEEMPLGKRFEDLPLVIRGDGQGNMLALFSDWMSLIYNDSGRGTSANRVAYKSDYIARITLNHFDLGGNQLAAYTFHDAFPKNDPSLNFSWDSQSIISFPITFRYKRYTHSISTSSAETAASINENNAALTGNQKIDFNTGFPASGIIRGV